VEYGPFVFAFHTTFKSPKDWTDTLFAVQAKHAHLQTGSLEKSTFHI